METVGPFAASLDRIPPENYNVRILAYYRFQ